MAELVRENGIASRIMTERDVDEKLAAFKPGESDTGGDCECSDEALDHDTINQIL